MLLNAFIKIQYYMLRRWLLSIRSNYLVRKHILMTPSRESIEREIILENIRFKQRSVEQKRWSYWVKICEQAKILGVDEAKIRSDSTIEQLETEDNIIKRKTNVEDN